MIFCDSFVLISCVILNCLYTVRVAYYEPAYYEHSFIMNQAEGPNKNNPIAFVLNKVRLI